VNDVIVGDHSPVAADHEAAAASQLSSSLVANN
jgi:hypothetical protein